MVLQLDLSNNKLCGIDDDGKGTYNAEGITAIADALRVNGALTALNLSNNYLNSESVSAVCEAIQSNKETKLASLNMGKNRFGPVGAKSVAAMVAVTGALTSLDLSNNALCGLVQGGFGGVSGTYTAEGITAIADALRVNGALTVTNLLGNKLDEESAKVLAEVAKQKGISLCGIRRDQTTADFSRQGLNPPDAILLASDLSQAVVTGALTALDLTFNYLKDEGVSAVCEAIQSNKETKLASLNFKNTGIGPVGANAVAAMVAVTGALTQVLVFRSP